MSLFEDTLSGAKACMYQLQCTVFLTEPLDLEAEIVLKEPQISHDGIRPWINKVIVRRI